MGLAGFDAQGRIGLFVTSGLGGMSGAQPKAGTIAGCVTVCAEVNPKITKIRHEQGWIHEVVEDLSLLVTRVRKALENKEVVSITVLAVLVVFQVAVLISAVMQNI